VCVSPLCTQATDDAAATASTGPSSWLSSVRAKMSALPTNLFESLEAADGVTVADGGAAGGGVTASAASSATTPTASTVTAAAGGIGGAAPSTPSTAATVDGWKGVKTLWQSARAFAAPRADAAASGGSDGCVPSYVLALRDMLRCVVSAAVSFYCIFALPDSVTASRVGAAHPVETTKRVRTTLTRGGCSAVDAADATVIAERVTTAACRAALLPGVGSKITGAAASVKDTAATAGSAIKGFFSSKATTIRNALPTPAIPRIMGGSGEAAAPEVEETYCGLSR
jgi:hypothetical protein